jgi:hypothetical protein
MTRKSIKQEKVQGREEEGEEKEKEEKNKREPFNRTNVANVCCDVLSTPTIAIKGKQT